MSRAGSEARSSKWLWEGVFESSGGGESGLVIVSFPEEKGGSTEREADDRSLARSELSVLLVPTASRVGLETGPTGGRTRSRGSTLFPCSTAGNCFVVNSDGRMTSSCPASSAPLRWK